MCNAWNHPKNCSCGWGCDGHTGRSANAFGAAVILNGWLISLTNIYHSYVNPNASCPVCGGAVFFYQSATGGRVFFDELGPPWPKHPCTDTNSRPGTAPPSWRTAGQLNVYNWQRAGWQPFVIESVVGIDNYYLKLTGVRQGLHLSLYEWQRLPDTKRYLLENWGSWRMSGMDVPRYVSPLAALMNQCCPEASPMTYVITDETAMLVDAAIARLITRNQQMGDFIWWYFGAKWTMVCITDVLWN